MENGEKAEKARGEIFTIASIGLHARSLWTDFLSSDLIDAEFSLEICAERNRARHEISLICMPFAPLRPPVSTFHPILIR